MKAILAAVISMVFAGYAQAGPFCPSNNYSSGYGHPGMWGPAYGYPVPPRYAPMAAPGYMQPAMAPYGYRQAAMPVQRQTMRAPEPIIASSAATGDSTITIRGMAFEPAGIRVKPGTTVTWVQADRAPHTVSSNGGKFDSATLQAGQSFTFEFNEAGVYDYTCGIHPMMRGKVIVEAPSS